MFHLQQQPLQAVSSRQILMNWSSTTMGKLKLLQWIDRLPKTVKGVVLFCYNTEFKTEIKGRIPYLEHDLRKVIIEAEHSKILKHGEQEIKFHNLTYLEKRGQEIGSTNNIEVLAIMQEGNSRLLNWLTSIYLMKRIASAAPAQSAPATKQAWKGMATIMPSSNASSIHTGMAWQTTDCWINNSWQFILHLQVYKSWFPHQKAH